MITILYAPKVSEYLNNLVDILYENNYFSFRKLLWLYLSVFLSFINANAELGRFSFCESKSLNKNK